MSSPMPSPSSSGPAPPSATGPDDPAVPQGKPPSKRWYRVAVLIAVAGLVAALAWWPYATTRIYDTTETFVRTRANGGTVTLASAGTHTFWIEGDCISCVNNNPAEYREVARVSVLDPAGAPVELRTVPSAWTFNTAKREGRALWIFDAPEPGAYKLSFALETLGRNWDNNYPQALSISPGVGLPVRIVRPMATLAGSGVALGLGLALLTAARRRRFYDRRYGKTPH